MASAGHGEYRHITEPEFLPEVTGSRLVLCHFYHDGFERCRILDKHLAPLAKKYFGTKFVKIHAPVRARPAPRPARPGHRREGGAGGACGRECR